MDHEHLSSTLEAPGDVPQRHATIASDARLRKFVMSAGVIGTGVLAAYFFSFMAYQTIWGGSDPSNWLVQLTRAHYPALVGTPMSAVTAFCIVSLLKVTSGPIEFEAPGFKFCGASGPIVMWMLCFICVVISFRLLWNVG